MHPYDLVEEINDTVQSWLDTNTEMVQVGRESIGLDPRAGYVVFVNEDCIVVPKSNQGSLEYYGGFEYVDKEYRSQIGDFVFYMGEDSRVRDHIEHWLESKGLCDSEDAA